MSFSRIYPETTVRIKSTVATFQKRPCTDNTVCTSTYAIFPGKLVRFVNYYNVPAELRTDGTNAYVHTYVGTCICHSKLAQLVFSFHFNPRTDKTDRQTTTKTCTWRTDQWFFSGRFNVDVEKNACLKRKRNT